MKVEEQRKPSAGKGDHYGISINFWHSFNLGLWENCFWCLCIWLRFLFVPDVLTISDNLDSVWSGAVSGIPKAREITISSLTSKRIHGLPEWYHIKVSDSRCSCYPGIFEENVQIFETGKLMLKKQRVYYYYINHLQSESPDPWVWSFYCQPRKLLHWATVQRKKEKKIPPTPKSVS